MIRPAATMRVDVHYGADGQADTYHRPGQRDPKHRLLRMSEQDARLIAVPCPVCFPVGEVTEGGEISDSSKVQRLGEVGPNARGSSAPSVTSSTEGEAA